jgi:putative ATPase
MTYLPPEMQGLQFYQPTDRGLERQLAEKMRYLRSLDQGASPDGQEAKDVD